MRIIIVFIVAFGLTVLCNAENVINRVLRQVLSYETATADQVNSVWNPFSWFQPRLNSIPYNPDTDLTTVSKYLYYLIDVFLFYTKFLCAVVGSTYNLENLEF